MDTSELMQKEIDRVKTNQSELYSLDREKQKVMADIQRDLAEIKTDHKNTKEAMSEVKKDITQMKTEITDIKNNVQKLDQKVTSVEKKVESVKTDLVTEIQNIKQNKWQPKDWTVIIVAIISLLGSIAAAFIGR